MKVRLVAVAVALLAVTVPGSGYGRGEQGAIRARAVLDRSGPTSDVGVPCSDGVRA